MKTIISIIVANKTTNYIIFVIITIIFELLNLFDIHKFNNSTKLLNMLNDALKEYEKFITTKQTLYQFYKVIISILKVVKLMKKDNITSNYTIDNSIRILSVTSACIRSYKSTNMFNFFSSEKIRKRIYNIDGHEKYFVNSALCRKLSIIPR